MRKFYNLLFPLLLTLSIIFFSCKKHEDVPQVARTRKTCRCDSTTDENNNIQVRFRYDASGRVIYAEDFYDSSVEYVNLEYYQDSIVATLHYDGNDNVEVYDINQSGLVTRRRVKLVNPSIEIYDTTYYTYNSDGYLLEETYHEHHVDLVGSSSSTTTSQNISHFVNNNDISDDFYLNGVFQFSSQYTYDTDDNHRYPFPGGFGWHHPEAFLFKYSKNVGITETEQGSTDSMAYQFNADGYPTQVDTYTQGVFQYTEKHWYTCK